MRSVPGAVLLLSLWERLGEGPDLSVVLSSPFGRGWVRVRSIVTGLPRGAHVSIASFRVCRKISLCGSLCHLCVSVVNLFSSIFITETQSIIEFVRIRMLFTSYFFAV